MIEKIKPSEKEIEQWIKCKDDLLYFVEHFIKVRTLDNDVIPIELTNEQKEIFRRILSNRRIGLDLDRQTGCSLMLEIVCLWTAMFNDYQNVGLFSHKFEHFKRDIDRIGFMYNQLPEWMKNLMPMVSNLRCSVEFENRSRIIGGTLDRGYYQGLTFNLLVVDNFSLISDELIEDFIKCYFPIHHAGKKSKMIFGTTGDKMSRVVRKLYRGLDAWVY